MNEEEGQSKTYSSHSLNTEDKCILCQVSRVRQCVLLPQLPEESLQPSQIRVVVRKIAYKNSQSSWLRSSNHVLNAPSKNKCMHPHSTNHMTVSSSEVGNLGFTFLTARYVNPKMAMHPATKEPKSDKTVDSLAE